MVEWARHHLMVPARQCGDSSRLPQRNIARDRDKTVVKSARPKRPCPATGAAVVAASASDLNLFGPAQRLARRLAEELAIVPCEVAKLIEAALDCGPCHADGRAVQERIAYQQ